MALETANYVNDLNSSNPAGSDAASTSDDHLRLIKQVLKNTFVSWPRALITGTTGIMYMPGGTTAQRPASPATAGIRRNTTTGYLDYYDGGTWHSVVTLDQANTFTGATIFSNTVTVQAALTLTGEASLTVNSANPALSLSQAGTGALINALGQSSIQAFYVASTGEVRMKPTYLANANPTGSSLITTLRAANTGNALCAYNVVETAADYAGTGITLHYAGVGTLAGAAPSSIYGYYSGNFSVGTGYQFYATGNEASNQYSFYAVGREAYFGGKTTLAGGFAKQPTVSAVASGSTITLTAATSKLIYNRTADVAALTIALPSTNLRDGQEIQFVFRFGVTTLTLSGGTIYNGPTAITAGQSFTLTYSSSASAWFRS